MPGDTINPEIDILNFSFGGFKDPGEPQIVMRACLKLHGFLFVFFSPLHSAPKLIKINVFPFDNKEVWFFSNPLFFFFTRKNLIS